MSEGKYTNLSFRLAREGRELSQAESEFIAHMGAAIMSACEATGLHPLTVESEFSFGKARVRLKAISDLQKTDERLVAPEEPNP